MKRTTSPSGSTTPGAHCGQRVHAATAGRCLVEGGGDRAAAQSAASRDHRNMERHASAAVPAKKPDNSNFPGRTRRSVRPGPHVISDPVSTTIASTMRHLLILCAILSSTAGASPTLRTVAGLPASVIAGRGATLPFDEYEAENAVTNGVQIGPDRRFSTVAAEASGRRAVRLSKQGDFVEFVLTRPANAIVVRAAIPDGAEGEARHATIDIFAGGRQVGALALTSGYGWFYGNYPFSNRPADGSAHHYFDEARTLLGRTLPAGTRVRLAVPKSDNAPWYAIDLADFEKVPLPSSMPAGALSVADFGADASGVRASDRAFLRAIRAASIHRRMLWIPPGTFRIDRHISVDHVHIRGAGPWYSILRGQRMGFYGKAAPLQSRDVWLEDFAILGETTQRVDNDQVNGIGGAIGGGSKLRNLWIQHTKAGLWFDGPMQGITISGLRILDTTADGLNFHRGVSDAVVENSFIRGTGDDGLAAWSGGQANQHILFRNNTIIAPVLANGIAIYGGRDIRVTANVVADTVTEGGAYHLGNRFNASPLAGTISLDRNIAIRSGSFDPHWRFGIGALWLYALDAPITADVRVRDLTLIDSSEEAIPQSVRALWLNDISIDGAGGPAIQLQSDGFAHISRIRAISVGAPGVRRCSHAFDLIVSGATGIIGDTDEGCPLGFH